MAEQNPAPTPEPAPEQTPEPKTDPVAELEKWRALARKHEAEAKRNAEAAAKLKQLEDAQKTELERIREAAEAAKREADNARMEAMRWRVAAKLGIPAQIAARLQGATEEEIEADAKELLAALAKTTPRDLPKDGAVSGATGTPTSDVEELDPRKLAAKINARW
jgi:flagellar biosynthesis GTPase FlhF